MILTKLLIGGALLLACLPYEPDIGLGRPQLSSQLLESARETVRDRLDAVKDDLAEHSKVAAQIGDVLNRHSKI
jgi:hypothetical protein